jgi:hypothetical protein
VRGGLRRFGESCLVNAIVLQAWEAAHGRRRDLVVGITRPDGFRAHAWLQGDPVPTADEAALDASALTTVPPARIRSDEAGAGAAGAPAHFSELLRRSAPDYRGARSVHIP